MSHPKGVLIERLQQQGRQPRFDTRAEGPDHEPTFESDVRVDDDVLGSGSGPTKRAAERRAAEEALKVLDDRPEATPEPAPTEAREAAPTAEDDLPFEGPWPVFERVLAASLTVAHDRVDGRLRGDEARAAVGAFALRLYKDLLEDLGDVVEVDEEG